MIQALFQCTSSDSATRSTAESFITELKQQPGFHPLLLSISQNPSLPEATKQLASIILKNSLANWKKSSVPNEDKLLIRSALLPCLKKSVTSKIRSQIEEVAQAVGKAEYPWDGINEQLHSFIDSQDPDFIYAALNLIFRISKNFEFVMGEKRNKLFGLVIGFFDKLEVLMARFLNEVDGIALDYVALILQIFWVSFYIELPESVISERMLNSWIGMFVRLMGLNLEASDVTEFTPSSKVTCKKLSTQILQRFFSRYNNPSNLIGTSQKIAQVFMSTWSTPVLTQVCHQILQVAHNPSPDQIKSSLLKYLNDSVKNPSTLPILQSLSADSSLPIISSLIQSVLTSILCKTSQDEELWQENPIEYIRKETDISRTYYSPSTACLDLLESLCSHGYQDQVLLHISTSLSSSPSSLQKEALLHQIGHLSSYLSSNPQFSASVETLLQTHVFPELSTQVHFLRARAVWAYGKFASFPMSSQDHQEKVLQSTCALLLDSELPVKFEAALTIPKLLKWEIGKARVRGEISNLLQVYLNLISQIDSEEIIEALEEIVENFDKEILPFAVDLVARLVVTFANLASREVADDNGDAAMAAVSTLNTIVRLVDTVRESQEDVVRVANLLGEVLNHCLARKGCEYMEEGLKLLALLLKYSPNAALPHFYPLLGTVLSSLVGEDPYGIEKTEGIFPVVGNFIKKYANLVINDLESLARLALAMVKGDKHVQMLGFKILMAIIENLRDSVTQIINNLISEVVSLFSSNLSNKAKASACQFLFVCIWAEPASTIQSTFQSGLLANVLKYSTSQIKLFEDRLPRTRMLVALCLVLKHLVIGQVLDDDSVKSVFNAVVKLLVLAEEESDLSDEEENVDAAEFDEKCQQLYKKIQENLEESDDEPPAIENEVDQDYDSIFEEMDYRAVARECLGAFGKDVLTKVLAGLEFELKAAFQRILPEIWNLANS